MEFIMSIMKKIAVAVFAASLFILSSCKETEEIKIADVSATVGESHFFNKKAVAKVLMMPTKVNQRSLRFSVTMEP